MTRWQEFKSAWHDLVTACRNALAYHLLLWAMRLHPGLAGEMVRMTRVSGKVEAEGDGYRHG